MHLRSGQHPKPSVLHRPVEPTDLILGLGGTAIGTLIERATRFTMLPHLPPLDGHSTGPRLKNGPALAGHDAEAVREAIASTITDLPAALNDRPRKTHDWLTATEMLDDQLTLRKEPGVATTG